jgi:hypothetical protein
MEGQLPPLPDPNHWTKDGIHATHVVLGQLGQEGPILFWAYSLDEASDAADIYRLHGYLDVKVFKEGPRREEATDNMIWKRIADPFW